MLKEVLRYNEDKSNLFINSTITELLKEKITLTVSVFAKNELGYSASSQISIDIFGNYDYYELIVPSNVRFYAFDGYKFTP